MRNYLFKLSKYGETIRCLCFANVVHTFFITRIDTQTKLHFIPLSHQEYV